MLAYLKSQYRIEPRWHKTYALVSSPTELYIHHHDTTLLRQFIPYLDIASFFLKSLLCSWAFL